MLWNPGPTAKYSDSGDFEGQGNNQAWGSGRSRSRSVAGSESRAGECEGDSGFAGAPIRRTCFVGIQHPGEKGVSHFPDGGDTSRHWRRVATRPHDGSDDSVTFTAARRGKGGGAFRAAPD